jgi:hypothetical protein
MGSEFVRDDFDYPADGCHIGYERMANAIKDLAKFSGRPPLFLSMCQWGRVWLSTLPKSGCSCSYPQLGAGVVLG